MLDRCGQERNRSTRESPAAPNLRLSDAQPMSSVLQGFEPTGRSFPWLEIAR